MPRPPRPPVRNPPASGKRSPQPAPDVTTLFDQAFALHQQGQLEQASALYDQVLQKSPRDFDALHLRGVIAARSQNPALAVELISRAIQVNPAVAAAHSNLGAALKALNRLEEAVASYDRAIRLTPNTAEAHSNRGNALTELRRMEEAIRSYEQAIALKPDYADAYANRGNALRDLRRLDEAIASYEQAIALKPDYEFLMGTLIHTYHQVCDWVGYEENNQQLEYLLQNHMKASPPFAAFTIVDSPSLQKIAAQVWVQAKCPPKSTLGPLPKPIRKEKIRLGYYSADFYDHATAYLMAELFELHDKTRFELIAFSFGPDVKDGMQRRVAAAFDQYIDVRSLSDLDVARMSRQLGVDVAVDLKGHTQHSRPGIFAHRCAPIQVNYLGYPGTMGADYMDYLIADPVLIPQEAQSHYTEKIVYLPHTYQVNDTQRVISPNRYTRQALGLPESGFVFCSFNNNFKITPQTFDAWMRILQAVEGSVLWLLEDNPVATRNLKKEAQARGVLADRLVFGPRLPLAEHLARHRLADLFLDTLPCNAHTTASDALWAGLPVLTLIGQSFAGRVAASLLHAIELPELVARSPAEYEQMAIRLAQEPEQIAALKAQIAANRRSAPLYDSPRFTRHIEQAYAQMLERCLQGTPPTHLTLGV